jgi:hypothetical protein
MVITRRMSIIPLSPLVWYGLGGHLHTWLKEEPEVLGNRHINKVKLKMTVGLCHQVTYYYIDTTMVTCLASSNILSGSVSTSI